MYKILGGDGKEYGPVSADTLRQWVAEGRANAETKVQPEGGGNWTALGQVAEFASLFAVAPPPPGAPVASSGTKIPNYLVQSILVTLCCCLPFGIAAIVYAAQVNTKVAAGDLAGAMESSNKAKMWCWIAFGLGLVANIIVVILQFAAAGLGSMQSH